MTVARAYQSLNELQEVLERTRFELSQSEITRQLQARDLARQTDEAREFRVQRDEAEAKLAAAAQVQADLNGALGKMAAELQSVRAALATAQASVSWQQSRLP